MFRNIFFLFCFTSSILTPISGQDGDSFILEYYEPSAETQFYANLLIESGIIDDAVADLNESFILPTPIRIVFASGIEGPQYNGDATINMPYDFLLYNDQVLGASQIAESPEDAADLLLNTTEFVLYHEVGHALVHVLDLPVLGKNEDAVDGFAAVLASIWELEEVALSAADIMGAQASLKGGSEITAAEFWDSHSLDEQRMFTIFCLIHGSNPQEHSGLLQEVGMPAEQSDRCQYDYQELYRNWGRVLEPYLRE